MVVSIAELVIVSIIVEWLFRKIKIPGLIGMLLIGVLCGPYVMDLLDPKLIAVSSDLRMLALIVILLRAGFELSKDTLNQVGFYALLLAFVPAVLEGAVITVAAHYFLQLTYLESAILGAIIAAVSPAVVVPLMIRFIEQRKGARKGIPTLVLAASSIDDVFVIVVYSVLIGIYTGQETAIAWQLAGIPLSIIIGIVVGLLAGFLLCELFQRCNPRATKRVLVILAVSALLVHIEQLLEGVLPFASLLAVMAIGFIILEKREHQAHEISARLAKLWILAEIVLFAMVGAQVNIHVAFEAGAAGMLVILLGLLARSAGSYLCLIGSGLTVPEKFFVVISYIPKATVQAAIGGAPLIAMKLGGMSTAPGETILAVAVLSILLTAPLGAWAIAVTGDRVLQVEPDSGVDALQAALESEAEGSDII